MQYKHKHRLSAALMAGAMCCTMIPAASADEISTPEIADTFVPEITDSVTPKSVQRFAGCTYRQLPRQHGSACGNRRDKNQHFLVGVRLVRR